MLGFREYLSVLNEQTIDWDLVRRGLPQPATKPQPATTPKYKYNPLTYNPGVDTSAMGSFAEQPNRATSGNIPKIKMPDPSLRIKEVRPPYSMPNLPSRLDAVSPKPNLYMPFPNPSTPSTNNPFGPYVTRDPFGRPIGFNYFDPKPYYLDSPVETSRPGLPSQRPPQPTRPTWDSTTTTPPSAEAPSAEASTSKGGKVSKIGAGAAQLVGGTIPLAGYESYMPTETREKMRQTGVKAGDTDINLDNLAQYGIFQLGSDIVTTSLGGNPMTAAKTFAPNVLGGMAGSQQGQKTARETAKALGAGETMQDVAGFAGSVGGYMGGADVANKVLTSQGRSALKSGGKGMLGKVGAAGAIADTIFTGIDQYNTPHWRGWKTELLDIADPGDLLALSGGKVGLGSLVATKGLKIGGALSRGLDLGPEPYAPMPVRKAIEGEPGKEKLKPEDLEAGMQMKKKAEAQARSRGFETAAEKDEKAKSEIQDRLKQVTQYADSPEVQSMIKSAEDEERKRLEKSQQETLNQADAAGYKIDRQSAINAGFFEPGEGEEKYDPFAPSEEDKKDKSTRR